MQGSEKAKKQRGQLIVEQDATQLLTILELLPSTMAQSGTMDIFNRQAAGSTTNGALRKVGESAESPTGWVCDCPCMCHASLFADWSH